MRAPHLLLRWSSAAPPLAVDVWSSLASITPEVLKSIQKHSRQRRFFAQFRSLSNGEELGCKPILPAQRGNQEKESSNGATRGMNAFFVRDVCVGFGGSTQSV